MLAAGDRLTVWWDALPADLRAATEPTGKESNVHPSDYVGPETCKQCHLRSHQRNYDSWSHHPHRWMNALANASTVKGDFSSGAVLSYRGGQATFSHSGAAYRMHLERGGVRRTYAVNQTLGSRFFQYYVGKQLEGPEPPGHHFYRRDHVLPFGYWLDQKEWVPVVHIGSEVPDDKRPDPFAPPDKGPYYADYAASCNYCHTTFPLGDLFGRRPHQIGKHAPVRLHWSMRPYLEQTHPAEARSLVALMKKGGARENPLAAWEAPRYAATLGISCEACHLGAREHVTSGGQVLPKFFPASPHLVAEKTAGAELEFGRSHDNVNWACGRCHTGTRPHFAAGMSTWNSVEYDDAMLGGCYSKLRCVDCHNPHRAIGPRWSLSPEQDDALCLKCHDKFTPARERLAHTHHPAGSEGARCMNCHMPRINEGLQDMVRTHMIYSPTRADMIEANHPNACNLCHTDRPIDWTLGKLKEWYGKTYDEGKVALNYLHRDRPAAQGWLKSGDPAVRLVAAAALTRARDNRALPQLLDALNDPYLVNRQFAARRLEELLKVRLADFGYRFYMSAAERRDPLARLRARFAGATAPKP
jgi:predicted CXXCH cytochrome family protein